MGAQRGLGRIFDVGMAFAPVDLNTAGATGLRFALTHATGITFIAALAAAGSGVEDVVFTVKQHTAYTSGTTNNLAAATVTTCSGITAWWLKAETTIDNDEPWAEQTQADGATVTVAGATYSTQQAIVAIYVSADQLGDGYTHVSLSVADPGSVARIGVALGIVHDMAYQRKPANLLNMLRPGAANV